MKYAVLHLSITLLYTLFNPLFAQESTTYSLEIHSIISEYGNTLGPVVDRSIKTQWGDWQKVTIGDGEYHIRVDFLEGLEPKQYHRKRANRRQYIYNVKYATPKYLAIVKAKNGMTLLQKTYGGNEVFSIFGAENEYSSTDTLADSWILQREVFYKSEEAKHNHVNVMLEDLAVIIEQGEVPIIESLEHSLVDMITPVTEKSEIEEEQEEVVLAVVETETEDKNINTTPIQSAPEINLEKAELKTEVPETPNNDLESDEIPEFEDMSIESPEPYTKPEEVTENIEIEVPAKEPKIDPATGRVAGETPPVPDPMERKTKEPVPTLEDKKPETQEDREARLARIQAEWDEMEKEEEEANKKPRVRHFRLGLRMLVPNLAGAHGEIVLPVLDNRISLVGDFSQFNFGRIINPFLQGDSGIDNVDVVFRYYSVGANYYFRKKYARGWYLGGSYLKGLVKTDVKDSDENTLGGKVDIDAGALRLGVTTGRKTFFFGFEVGAAVPLDKLQGTFYFETDGELDIEVIDEKIPVLPILNITLGVAL